MISDIYDYVSAGIVFIVPPLIFAVITALLITRFENVGILMVWTSAVFLCTLRWIEHLQKTYDGENAD